MPETGPSGASHKGFLTPFSRFGTNLLLILARLNAATVTGLIAAGCIAAGVFCSLSRGGTLAMLGAAIITLLAAALAGRWRRGWLGPMLVTGVAACLLVGYVGQGDRVQQRLATLLGVPAGRQVRIVLPVGVPGEKWNQKEKLPFAQRAWESNHPAFEMMTQEAREKLAKDPDWFAKARG